jgi:hypothetical protein
MPSNGSARFWPTGAVSAERWYATSALTLCSARRLGRPERRRSGRSGDPEHEAETPRGPLPASLSRRVGGGPVLCGSAPNGPRLLTVRVCWLGWVVGDVVDVGIQVAELPLGLGACQWPSRDQHAVRPLRTSGNGMPSSGPSPPGPGRSPGPARRWPAGCHNGSGPAGSRPARGGRARVPRKRLPDRRRRTPFSVLTGS